MNETYTQVGSLVEYQGSMVGKVQIDQEDMESSLFTCQMDVLNDIVYVTYEGNIHTILETVKETYEQTLQGSLEIANAELNVEIPATITIPELKSQNGIFKGYLEIKKEDFLQNIVKGDLEYQSVNVDIDIPVSMVVEQLFDDGKIQGTVQIDMEVCKTDFPCEIDIQGVQLQNDIIRGEVYVFAQYVDKWIKGNVVYTKSNYNETILQGHVGFEEQSAGYIFPCTMKVQDHHFIYSIFAKMNVVDPYNMDLPCQMEVSNPYLTDVLWGSVTTENEAYSEKIITGEVENSPHIAQYIKGEFELLGIDTYKNLFDASMTVVDGINTEFDCKINVEEFVARQYNFDFDANMRVGDLYHASFPVSLILDEIYNDFREFFATMEIVPPREKAKIGIFVDPLWSVSAFTLKSALITFFNRYYQNTDICMVYGGNPKTDWDIHKIGHIYHLPDVNMVKVPVQYIGGNPIHNRESVLRFIRTLTEFASDTPLDRVFIFSDISYTRHTTMMTPLIEFCKDNRIPGIIITSKGDFTETEIMVNYPQAADLTHPDGLALGGFHGPFGYRPTADSKHRIVFDDRPIV